MRFLRSVTILFLLSMHARAVTGAWQSLGNISGVEALAQGAELKAGVARIRVMALSPNVVRVRYAPQGSFPPEYSFAVLPNAFPPAPKIQLQQSAEEISFTTRGMQVRILRSPLRIVFL